MDESIVVSRFARIIASLKHALLHQDFEAGRLLIELEKEKDYGEWGTFDNFVDSELRITPRHAYRLMFAYRMREFFKEHDRLLPICESQVRPLAALDENRQRAKIKLTLEELQLRAWDLAIAVKQRSTPTQTDVRRAVRQLMTPKLDQETDKAFQAYRRRANRIWRTEMARMHKLWPDLEEFFRQCDEVEADKKTKRRKKEMAEMLLKMVISLNKQYLSFAGQWEPDQKIFEKGDYLAALAKAKRLSRTIVGLRVRDFRHRHKWEGAQDFWTKYFSKPPKAGRSYG